MPDRDTNLEALVSGAQRRYPHLLHVRIDEVGIVDDYGNEVEPPSYRMWIDCPYGGGGNECRLVYECDCVNPEEDERFAALAGVPWPERGSHPLWGAFELAMSAYEEVDETWGWHPTEGCWAQEKLSDWRDEDSDDVWRINYPGDWPVSISAEGVWVPDEAILVLTPWVDNAQAVAS